MAAATRFRNYRVRITSPQGDTLLDDIVRATDRERAILRGYDDVREVLTASAEEIPDAARPAPGAETGKD
jgi:hypothetical protein